ncbi:MAG: hypothetical protein ABL889_13670 [Terricaulis sp.]
MQESVASPGEHVALATLAAASLRPVARVIASDRATDLAFSLSPTRVAVIRCVEHVTPEHHTALATMLSEGPFIWGAVVYDQGEAPQSPGLIESFHVSQLDQLVARLVELREASR